jgi:hypothetical protein
MEEEEQLFDTAVIFAANINYDDQLQSPIIHLNTEVTALLDDNIEKVQELQAKGIKVVLDILGNHQNAGWACFSDEQEINDFADLVKVTVDQYNLDGIDIDDEYSTCNTNDDSLIKISKAIKDRMPDKLLTKALYADSTYFNANWNNQTLGDQLNYGWEMSYSNSSCTARLNQYVTAGVDLNKLGVGASTVITSANTAKELAACAMDNGFNGGMMIFNVTSSSLSYLQKIWNGVTAKPSCLS